MKVVVSKIDLVGIIGKIQNIVPVKPTAPILANVLLEAMDDQIILSATDLSVSMRCSIDAKVIEEGSVALPARRFFQLVRELTAPQIKISAETNDTAEITTGASVFKIHAMNRAEFPHLPDLAGTIELVLGKAILKEALTKTAFAAAREDSRFTINGVQLQLAQQKATFIGTDGKRLSKIAAPVAIDPALQSSYVIPLKAVEEMVKLLDDTEAPVTLSLAHDKVSLETGSLTLIAKLLAGQYPDVDKVIPANLRHRFSIHREELMALLRQISLFTSTTSNSVRFSFETGQLHLSAMSNEVGEGRVSMPVDYSGSKLDIAFNPFFFLDILKHSKDETIRFGLNDAHNPGIITDTTNALFVIMPMRLNETSEMAVQPSTAAL
ncbi:MAG: DNA polymerase III subunit beta [Chlamydiia bacterium]|nr:DNA polymerase III subunit beta [Chlamydiia bacterium]